MAVAHCRFLKHDATRAIWVCTALPCTSAHGGSQYPTEHTEGKLPASTVFCCSVIGCTPADGFPSTTCCPPPFLVWQCESQVGQQEIFLLQRRTSSLRGCWVLCVLFTTLPMHRRHGRGIRCTSQTAPNGPLRELLSTTGGSGCRG